MSIAFAKKAEKNKRRRDHPAAVIRLCLKAIAPKRPALPQISSIQSRIRSARRPAATARGFSRTDTVERDQHGAGQHKPN